MKLKMYLGLACLFISSFATAGQANVNGQITSLMASASAPAIRIGDRLVPTGCDGGPYGWLYFKGIQQEQQWLYSSALALSLSGKAVTVYTNTDGAKCAIENIQITSGLN